MQRTKFDYVVVGSGPGSGPVVRRLVDEGFTVAVLEKGPFFNPPPDDPTKKVSGRDFDDTFIVNEDELMRKGTAAPCPTPKPAATPQPVFPLRPRKKGYPYLQYQGFGGQTLTYGGIYIRPSPDAFKPWPGITYEEMLPYYERLENVTATWVCKQGGGPGHDCGRRQDSRQKRGYMPLHRDRTDRLAMIARNISILCQKFANDKTVNNMYVSGWEDTSGDKDYNAQAALRAFCGPTQVYQEVNATTDRVTLRGSLQYTYLPKSFIEQSSRLSVCVNASVDYLEFASDNVTISAAVLASTGVAIKGKRFVLSSGVRFTPEVLMKSGIGDAATLKQYSKYASGPTVDLPDVGRHFHDEWAYSLSFVIPTNAAYWLKDAANQFKRDQMQLAKFSTGVWGANFSDVQLYFRTGNTLSLDEFLPTSMQFGVPAAKKVVDSGQGFLAIRVAMFQNESFGRGSGFFPSGTDGVRPNRFTNRIKMFDSQDLFQRFMVGAKAGYGMAMKFVSALQQVKDPTGKALTLTPIKTTADLMAAATNPDPRSFEAALQDWANVLALHGGGTAGIGRVVDKNLRVLNMTNLYVCDMSVFPTPVDANPTATIFALGERLANHLMSILPPFAVPTWSNTLVSMFTDRGDCVRGYLQTYCAGRGGIVALNNSNGKVFWPQSGMDGGRIALVGWNLISSQSTCKGSTCSCTVNMLNPSTGTTVETISIPGGEARHRAAIQSGVVYQPLSSPNSTSGIYAIEFSSKRIAWQYTGVPQAAHPSTPAVLDQHVYFSSDNGYVTALRNQFTQAAVLWQVSVPAVSSNSVPLVTPEFLLVAAKDAVYSLGLESGESLFKTPAPSNSMHLEYISTLELVVFCTETFIAALFIQDPALIAWKYTFDAQQSPAPTFSTTSDDVLVALNQGEAPFIVDLHARNGTVRSKTKLDGPVDYLDATASNVYVTVNNVIQKIPFPFPY